jgi:hypothetical protein
MAGEQAKKSQVHGSLDGREPVSGGEGKWH